MAFWNRTQQMGWAALILGAGTLLSRFMGLLRDKIISFFFGATQESDLYFAAFVIPDFINYLLAGGYFSITLIPLLASYFEENEEEGWRFFSTVLTWLAVAITLLTGVAMIFAPQLVHLTAPGFQEPASARLALFLRIILPAQICFLTGSCFTSILYLRKQFMVPALMPLIYNFFIIMGGMLLRNRGMEGFCWGVLIGAFLGNFLLPYAAVRHSRQHKITFSWYHPGLKRFIYIALPLMIGQSFVVLDEQLTRVFGSLAATGSISWLNYARRIMLVPVGVVAQAAGLASYPFLAALAVKKDFPSLYQTLNTALHNTLALLIPLSIWMMIVAEPTICLIFQQGHFGARDTSQTAFLLKVFLTVVFCWGFQQILVRGFYALQDTLTPAILGTITTVIALPIFFLLSHYLGAVGVASASALGVLIYTMMLGLWWQRRFGKDTFRGLGTFVLKLTFFSLLSCIPGILLTRLFFSNQGQNLYISALMAILMSGIGFGLFFVLLSLRFAPSIVEPFLEKTGFWKRKNRGTS